MYQWRYWLYLGINCVLSQRILLEFGTNGQLLVPCIGSGCLATIHQTSSHSIHYLSGHHFLFEPPGSYTTKAS